MLCSPKTNDGRQLRQHRDTTINKPSETSMLLHIQTISEGKRKSHIDFRVKMLKVSLPETFWLHYISYRISLRLLITDNSDFFKNGGWWVKDIQSIITDNKINYCLKSVTIASRKSFVSLSFWWIVPAIVLFKHFFYELLMCFGIHAVPFTISLIFYTLNPKVQVK